MIRIISIGRAKWQSLTSSTLAWRPLLVSLASIFLLFPISSANAERRVALVVGNSNYKNISPLDNPRNDAKLMAETLRSVGFALVGGAEQINLTKQSFDSAIQEFGNQLAGADVALFYYAGHGVQVRGSNYMVPTSANPTKEADVDFQMVDVSLVLRQMEGAGTRLNLVILDACRNNPFAARGLRSADAGLAQMRAPQGTLISYATQPGNVAQDGSYGNSPYTSALSQSMLKAGLDIFQTFNEVGLAVKRSTGGQQQPWLSSSPIDGNFYFSSRPSPPSAELQSATMSDAAQAWNAVKDTTNPTLLEAFSKRYSSTFFSELARARIEELKQAASSAKSMIASVSPAEQFVPSSSLDTNTERAVLYDEDPQQPKGKQYAGTVVWRTERVKAKGSPQETVAVRGDVTVPERLLKMSILFRRNDDRKLPASHTAEITFVLPTDFIGGGVGNLPGILMKSNEQARGTPLAGLAVKISDGFFLVGLSDVAADKQRNMQLLKERSWFDIPIVYNNQRRGIIAVEKGSVGDKAFQLALAAEVAKPEVVAPAQSFLVQVNSQRSEDDARASFRALQQRFPSTLGTRKATIKKSDLGDKGIYYRAGVGPFATSDEASRFCDGLKTEGGQCVVQRN